MPRAIRAASARAASLATDPTALVFEARSPGSVADLVIGKPRAEGSCLVRGRLFVGKSVPQLECRIMGLGRRGSSSELSIDLPPTWVADRLQWSGVDELVTWHSRVRDDGGTRLRILLSHAERSPRSPHADRGRDFCLARGPRAARPSPGPAIGRRCE